MVAKHLVTSFLALLLFTLITGILYPLAVTGMAHLLFPEKSEGSLIRRDGRIVGSELIGQPFSDPKYFWGRPSSTTPYPYDAAASTGSNTGPLNPALTDEVKARLADIRKADPLAGLPVPADLVTSSGSGLDPHISVAAARYQVGRVARVRGMDPARVQQIVDLHTEGRTFGVLGEPRVNVLNLNIALDAAARNQEERRP